MLNDNGRLSKGCTWVECWCFCSLGLVFLCFGVPPVTDVAHTRKPLLFVQEMVSPTFLFPLWKWSSYLEDRAAVALIFGTISLLSSQLEAQASFRLELQSNTQRGTSANLPWDFPQNRRYEQIIYASEHLNTRHFNMCTWACSPEATRRVFSASPRLATKRHDSTPHKGSADVDRGDEPRRHMEPGTFSPPRRRIKESVQPLTSVH